MVENISPRSLVHATCSHPGGAAQTDVDTNAKAIIRKGCWEEQLISFWECLICFLLFPHHTFLHDAFWQPPENRRELVARRCASVCLGGENDSSDNSIVTVKKTVIFFTQNVKCSVCCIAFWSIQEAVTGENGICAFSIMDGW